MVLTRHRAKSQAAYMRYIVLKLLRARLPCDLVESITTQLWVTIPHVVVRADASDKELLHRSTLRKDTAVALEAAEAGVAAAVREHALLVVLGARRRRRRGGWERRRLWWRWRLDPIRRACPRARVLALGSLCFLHFAPQSLPPARVASVAFQWPLSFASPVTRPCRVGIAGIRRCPWRTYRRLSGSRTRRRSRSL